MVCGNNVATWFAAQMHLCELDFAVAKWLHVEALRFKANLAEKVCIVYLNRWNLILISVECGMVG